jgi:hypothetical protein
MKKKKRGGHSAKVSPKKVTRIHLFYVIALVWVAGTALAYGIVTHRENDVLSAQSMLARGVERDGESEGTDADHKGPDTERTVQGQSGKEINDRSGKSNKGPRSGLLQKLKEKIRGKNEHKASESGRGNDPDLIVASESGVPIKLQKSRKEKILVLPEKAVAALLRNGIIQQVASGSGDASAAGRVVYMRTNGTPVYVIAGTKEEKLFGAFPVKIQKTVTVSAETGEVIEEKKSLPTMLLDLISF